MVLGMELILGLVHARQVLILCPWKEISLDAFVDCGLTEPRNIGLQLRILCLCFLKAGVTALRYRAGPSHLLNKEPNHTMGPYCE